MGAYAKVSRQHYNRKRPHSALGITAASPGGSNAPRAKTVYALTLHTDHSVGADQDLSQNRRYRPVNI